MIQHNYIDTDYLLSYLFFSKKELKKYLGKEKSLEKERYNILNNFVKKQKNNVVLKIPLIVLGEVNVKLVKYPEIIEDEVSFFHIRRKILDLFKHEEIDLNPPKKECYETAKILVESNEQHEIHPTDALIVSQALHDVNSKYFLTLDKVLIESLNRGIISEENQRLKGTNLLKIYPNKFI